MSNSLETRMVRLRSEDEGSNRQISWHPWIRPTERPGEAAFRIGLSVLDSQVGASPGSMQHTLGKSQLQVTHLKRGHHIFSQTLHYLETRLSKSYPLMFSEPSQSLSNLAMLFTLGANARTALQAHVAKSVSVSGAMANLPGASAPKASASGWVKAALDWVDGLLKIEPDLDKKIRIIKAAKVLVELSRAE